MSQQTSEMEQLARAVATDLSCDAFAESFLAHYDPRPIVELKDLSQLLVTVRDIGQTTVETRASRGAYSEHEYNIEVNLWRQVETDMSAAVSRIKYVGEQIADYFRFMPATKAQWPTGRNERLKRVEDLTQVDDESLDKLGLMRVRMMLIFRGWRA